MSQYWIRKVRREGMVEIGFLSIRKTRWIHFHSRHKKAVMNEADALQFTNDRSEDDEHYYFRCIAWDEK